MESVGPRHAATAIAALLLLGASRLPLTRKGTGSATAAIDLLRLGSHLDDPALRTVSIISVWVLALGLVLGVAVVVPGAFARTVWWMAAAVVAASAVVGVALLRARTGPAVLAVAAAALVLCGTPVADRCVSRMRTSS